MTVYGLVGLVEEGITFSSAASLIISGACPPPAPSVWKACIVRPPIALMVFSTAFGTALFGVLIDIGFSIEKIAIISAIYIFLSFVLLFFTRKKLNPVTI